MTNHAGEFKIALSRLRIPTNRTRYPLPGDLMRLLIRETITVIEAVRQWMARTDDINERVANIRQLADSIATVGLINPIVITDDSTLISGLRRVLAQAFLVTQGHTEFATIRAIAMDRSWSLAQQMAETLVREDLTAVETAINLGFLIAEIEESPIEANQPLFDSGGMITVPIELRQHLLSRRVYGTWEKIIAILGKTYRHWTNYVRILRLCDPALTLAHQAGLTEWSLRVVVAEDLSREAQVKRIKEMISGKPLEEDEEDHTKSPLLSRPALAVKGVLDAATFWALLPSGCLDLVATDTFNAHDAGDFEAIYQIVEKIVIALRTLREQDFDKFSRRRSLEAKRLLQASDYLSTLQPDNLDRAIAEFFSGKSIEKLEKFYQAGERMRTALGELRGKHHSGYQR